MAPSAKTPPWNGVDDRAFVPTPDMQGVLDVLPGAASGVAKSRSPFSLGVYKVNRDSPSTAAAPMRMYFVSNAVAHDRSQTGPPMDSGWYICVDDTDSEFEVRVTPRAEKWVKSFRRELPGCDAASIRLEIDGESVGCNERTKRDRSEEIQRRDKSFKGFLESKNRSGKKKLRALTFAKLILDEDSSEPDSGGDQSVGTLKLQIIGGMSVPNVQRSHGSRKYCRGIEKMKSTSEKKAIKKGTSVGVARDGTVLSEQYRGCDDTLCGRKTFDALAIVVNIRERPWLIRRRILTEAGKPWTKDEAELMRAQSESAGAEPESKWHKQESEEIVYRT